MARLNSNKLLPILGGVVLLTLGVVAANSVFSKGDATSKPRTSLPAPDKQPDGDTPVDTIRALKAELSAASQKFDEVVDQNKQLLANNETLRGDQAKIRDDLSKELEEKLAAANFDQSSKFDQSVSALGEQLSSLKTSLTVQKPEQKKEEAVQILPSADAYPIAGAKKDRYIWIEPLDGTATASLATTGLAPNGTAGGDLLPSGFTPSGSPTALSGANENAASLLPTPALEATSTPTPYFTINNLATLAGSTAFTAMIGRVPIDGQIADPVPFRVLVGRDNLAASGLRVPDEIASMVFEGVAIGDWTLGCVEGSLRTATFIFEDGTIRTVSSGSGQEGRLGYIADRFGTPCVAGERISNAGGYLAAQVGLAAGAGAAEAFSAAQTAQVVEDGSISTAVVGDVAKFALGRAASDATTEVQRYLANRLSNTFDAVYVPPGQEVALLIQQEIAIDYDPDGRKLDHAEGDLISYRTLD